MTKYGVLTFILASGLVLGACGKSKNAKEETSGDNKNAVDTVLVTGIAQNNNGTETAAEVINTRNHIYTTSNPRTLDSVLFFAERGDTLVIKHNVGNIIFKSCYPNVKWKAVKNLTAARMKNDWLKQNHR